MTSVRTTTTIDRPIEQVFDYVTTPANWPLWHPSSLSVSGAADHSLNAGEQVTEEFRVAGRRGRTVWTVREREAPHRWSIDARIAGRRAGTVTYTLSRDAGGTRFQREFEYRMPNMPMFLLDLILLRRRITAESTEALRRLRRVLESGG